MRYQLVRIGLVGSIYGFALLGCDFFDSGVDLTIETGEDSYESLVEPGIELTIRNDGDTSVYYQCGGAIRLEQWKDGKLDFSWPPSELLCGRISELKPGQTTTRRVGISPQQFESYGMPTLTSSTTFRFRVTAYSDKNVQDEIEVSEQRSNQFRVTQIGL